MSSLSDIGSIATVLMSFLVGVDFGGGEGDAILSAFEFPVMFNVPVWYIDRGKRWIASSITSFS